MNYLLTLTLALLLTLTNLGAVAHAEVIKTGSTFYIPVQFERGPEIINVIEGSIRIPQGITVEHIDTTGSSLRVFAHGPTLDLSQGTIEFTGGTPQGIEEATGTLFVIQARADSVGTYTILPRSVSAYEHNGEGTQVGITVPAVTVTVRDDGEVEERASEGASTPLVTAIGKEETLFEGKWFVTFYGGESGAMIDRYEVKEGWFGKTVSAERYHVLRDQGRSATLFVTAVDANGNTVSTRIAPENPWPERFLFGGGIALLVVLCGAFYFLVLRKRNR
jgi:hypothetical protein